MENSKEIVPDLLSGNQLHVDEQSGSQLKDTVVWAKTIAITLCVLCGLAVLAVVFLGSFFGGNNLFKQNDYLVVIAITVAIIVGIASLFIINLFRFTNGMADGIANQDPTAFDKGITGLRNFFICTGVLTLLLTFIYLVGLVK